VSRARAVITRASSGLAANMMPSGMPAVRHRPGSVTHQAGRYSSRSIGVCLAAEA
jgi:hypothetical protein